MKSFKGAFVLLLVAQVRKINIQYKFLIFKLKLDFDFFQAQCFSILNLIFQPSNVPEMDLEKNWGDNRTSASEEIVPFKIQNVTDIIDDLRQRLSVPLDLQKPVLNTNFEYGFNSEYLEKLVDYWRDDYLARWDERQAFLNQFPQFTTVIQAL